MPAITCQGSMCVTGETQSETNFFVTLNVFRYLVVLYYQANKAFEKMDAAKKEADLMKMKEKYNLNTPAR